MDTHEGLRCVCLCVCEFHKLWILFSRGICKKEHEVFWGI